MSEKLCVFCKHLELDVRGCYGEYPDPATFECSRGHFKNIEASYQISTEEFREKIVKAQTCKDYDQA
jgi:hypothetical protein